ncbi:MAG: HAD-IIIC family phosphatase, partial [Candidatus Omnitrophica bacterium]|nr:HAD-IIIC family phosphatase [Candidatus Omnitrophota bacterium]
YCINLARIFQYQSEAIEGNADWAHTRPGHKTPSYADTCYYIDALGDLTKFPAIEGDFVKDIIWRLERIGEKEASKELKLIYEGKRIRVAPKEGIFNDIFGCKYSRDCPNYKWIVVAADIAADLPKLIHTTTHESGTTVGCSDEMNEEIVRRCEAFDPEEAARKQQEGIIFEKEIIFNHYWEPEIAFQFGMLEKLQDCLREIEKLNIDWKKPDSSSDTKIKEIAAKVKYRLMSMQAYREEKNNPLDEQMKNFGLIFVIRELMVNAYEASIRRVSAGSLVPVPGAQSITFGRIGITIKLTSEELKIFIRDNGAGLKDDNSGQFINFNKTCHYVRGKGGFGIPLSKVLVEYHGGKIEWASPSIYPEGLGTQVTITLPVNAIQDWEKDYHCCVDKIKGSLIEEPVTNKDSHLSVIKSEIDKKIKANPGKIFVVAIDGNSGAFKTTQAARLAELINHSGGRAVVISRDWFIHERDRRYSNQNDALFFKAHSFDDDEISLRRADFETSCLNKLKEFKQQDTQEATLFLTELYDATSGQLTGRQEITITAGTIVIIEGNYLLSTKKNWHELFDLKVLMLASPSVGIKRRLPRDSHPDKKRIEKVFWRINTPSFVHYLQEEILKPDLVMMTDDNGSFCAAGHNKIAPKCIVLDCDGVLWQGIVGEDGLNGIKLTSAHRSLQQALKSLKETGMILAINSKNNPQDIEEALKKHPDMVLKKTDFAAIKANWQDKATNMREIAQELNIGLGSLLFLDDSVQQRELIRNNCPEVLVIDLPQEADNWINLLENLGLFEPRIVTKEDAARTESYAAKKQREELKQQTGSLEAYYRSLGMRAIFRKNQANRPYISRIAQLSQRTHQFNLTGKRYSEAQVEALLIPDNNYSVYTIELIDKFGNSGIVGLMVVTDGYLIEEFCLSCRALGLTVENAFMAYVSKDKHVNHNYPLCGIYKSTAKNALFSGTYEQLGFHKEEERADGRVIWRLSERLEPPGWITLIPSIPITPDKNMNNQQLAEEWFKLTATYRLSDKLLRESLAITSRLSQEVLRKLLVLEINYIGFKLLTGEIEGKYQAIKVANRESTVTKIKLMADGFIILKKRSSADYSMEEIDYCLPGEARLICYAVPLSSHLAALFGTNSAHDWIDKAYDLCIGHQKLNLLEAERSYDKNSPLFLDGIIEKARLSGKKWEDYLRGYYPTPEEVEKNTAEFRKLCSGGIDGIPLKLIEFVRDNQPCYFSDSCIGYLSKFDKEGTIQVASTWAPIGESSIGDTYYNVEIYYYNRSKLAAFSFAEIELLQKEYKKIRALADKPFPALTTDGAAGGLRCYAWPITLAIMLGGLAEYIQTAQISGSPQYLQKIASVVVFILGAATFTVLLGLLMKAWKLTMVRKQLNKENRFIREILGLLEESTSFNKGIGQRIVLTGDFLDAMIGDTIIDRARDYRKYVYELMSHIEDSITDQNLILAYHQKLHAKLASLFRDVSVLVRPSFQQEALSVIDIICKEAINMITAVESSAIAILKYDKARNVFTENDITKRELVLEKESRNIIQSSRTIKKGFDGLILACNKASAKSIGNNKGSEGPQSLSRDVHYKQMLPPEPGTPEWSYNWQLGLGERYGFRSGGFQVFHHGEMPVPGANMEPWAHKKERIKEKLRSSNEAMRMAAGVEINMLTGAEEIKQVIKLAHDIAFCEDWPYALSREQVVEIKTFSKILMASLLRKYQEITGFKEKSFEEREQQAAKDAELNEQFGLIFAEINKSFLWQFKYWRLEDISRPDDLAKLRKTKSGLEELLKREPGFHQDFYDYITGLIDDMEYFRAQKAGLGWGITAEIAKKLPAIYKNAYYEVIDRLMDDGLGIFSPERDWLVAKKELLRESAEAAVKMDSQAIEQRLKAVEILIPYKLAMLDVNDHLPDGWKYQKLTADKCYWLLAKKQLLEEYGKNIFERAFRGEINDPAAVRQALTQIEQQVPEQARKLSHEGTRKGLRIFRFTCCHAWLLLLLFTPGGLSEFWNSAHFIHAPPVILVGLIAVTLIFFKYILPRLNHKQAPITNNHKKYIKLVLAAEILYCAVVFSGLYGAYRIGKYTSSPIAAAQTEEKGDCLLVGCGCYAVGGNGMSRYLIADNIGQGVGLILYDINSRVGLVAHFERGLDTRELFDDFLEKLTFFGANKDGLIACIIGGRSGASEAEINVLKNELRSRGIYIAWEDVLGQEIRSFFLDVKTGEVKVTKCILGGQKPVTPQKQSMSLYRHARPVMLLFIGVGELGEFLNSIFAHAPPVILAGLIIYFAYSQIKKAAKFIASKLKLLQISLKRVIIILLCLASLWPMNGCATTPDYRSIAEHELANKNYYGAYINYSLALNLAKQPLKKIDSLTPEERAKFLDTINYGYIYFVDANMRKILSELGFSEEELEANRVKTASKIASGMFLPPFITGNSPAGSFPNMGIHLSKEVIERNNFISSTFNSAKSGDPNSVEPLISIVSSPKEYNPENRFDAVKYLNNFESPKITEALMKYSFDADDSIRYVSIWALGNRAEPAALKIFTKALKDKNVYIVNEAIIALGKLGDQKASADLVNCYKRYKNNDEVVLRIAIALGQIEDSGNIKLLINLAKHKNKEIRSVAIYGLSGYDTEQINAIKLSALKDPEPIVRQQAVLVLKEKAAGNKEIADAVLGLLKSEANPDVILACIDALSGNPDPEVKAVVSGFKNNTDWRMRYAVVLHLAVFPEEEAAFEVAGMLDDEREEVRQAAVAVLSARVPDYPWVFERIYQKF